MIATVVAESQPRRTRPGGLADQLMTEADAEHRHTLDELPGHRHRRLQLRRITRTVGEHDRLGTEGEDGLEVAVVGHDVDLHATGAKRAQDVALDPVVDEHQPQAGPLAQRPGRERRIERLRDVAESLGDLPDQVLFLERGHAVHPLEQRGEFVPRPDDRPLRTGAAQMPGKPPGIAAGEDGNAVAVEPVGDRLLGAPVFMKRTPLTRDQRSSPGATRLLEFRRRAVVPDQGIGHDDHLPGVRRVREHLLVARHAGVDHDFAARLGRLPTALAEDGEAILEDEDHRVRHAASRAR